MTATKTSELTRWDENIYTAMRAYYENYYREQLGLPDWLARVERRLHEEDTALSLICKVERWSNTTFGDGCRILIVGGGTGGETFALRSLGCDVVAVEPDADAAEILRMKAAAADLAAEHIHEIGGERLPFSDGEFDWVWCHTVLEHVQDVEACIAEIVRVIRPDGRAFIETPDYRQFYEPHYKLTLPMCLPKWIIALWMRLKGRDPAFLSTLQFVTTTRLANAFQNSRVEAMQVIQPWPEAWKSNLSFSMGLVKWMIRRYGIQRDQFWLLRKMETDRCQP